MIALFAGVVLTASMLAFPVSAAQEISVEEDIPAFVICGTDICSVQAMEAYYHLAVEKCCNSNVLEDLKLAIEDFKAFQCEEPEKVKIPD